MTSTVSRFETRPAPCGQVHDGESFVTEDQQGLMTEDLQFTCGCRESKGPADPVTNPHRRRAPAMRRMRVILRPKPWLDPRHGRSHNGPP